MHVIVIYEHILLLLIREEISQYIPLTHDVMIHLHNMLLPNQTEWYVNYNIEVRTIVMYVCMHDLTIERSGM